ncbi:sulfatase-like hydrolase/transferase [Acidobacteria bacterium AH-259-A15]|nr:sulfatase-like hydrolase/transferase [Acidobacteria bacterium AH-259-A15]
MNSLLRHPVTVLPLLVLEGPPRIAAKTAFSILCPVLSLLFCFSWAFGQSNLLLVTIDTLRADRLGCYGYARAGTPVLDQLAREGIRFERAFSPVPLTLPSHASILTGTYPSYHGVRDNSGYVLPPEQSTLAETLKQAGYATAAFVGAFVLDSKFGLDQGFDYYYDDFDLSQHENVSPGYVQRTGDQVVTQAISWLNSNLRKPFFLWVHLYDPHDLYTPPEPYASRHPGRPYDGEIEFTDTNVGTLVDWLRNNGIYEDTLVVVVGDHGESLGEHQEDKHGLFVYNATLHVPMIVRLPQGERAGRTIAENVGIIDLFPTVLQVLRVDRKLIPEVQGSGLMSLILGKSRDHRVDLYAECYYSYRQFGWSPVRALISASYKYILAPTPELYDLSRDFGEKHNLAPENQVLANRMRQDLEDLMGHFTRPAQAQKSRAQLDSETLEKLRSLGYVALSAGTGKSTDFGSLRDPKDQIILYNRILDLFEISSRGDYEKAIRGYEQILNAQPDLKIVRYKLGQAYYHTGNYNAAQEQFKKAIELGGDQALAAFDLAQTHLKLGRVEDAILGFQRTVEIDPGHYRARTNLGVLYKNQGKIPEAIQQLEKALALSPNSVFALNNLGVAYSMAEQHDKGIEALKKAITLSPENAVLRANLGLVYRRMGREEEARKQFQIARRLNPQLFKH